MAGSQSLAGENEIDRRNPVHEGRAEIAGERGRYEQRKLHPQRTVEAEPLDGLLALELISLGADQDVDRIAKRIDADEHQGGHYGHDEEPLPEPPDQEREH